MSKHDRIGVGLLGCGAFGEFCLNAFAATTGVRVAAVADTRVEAARRLGTRFHVPAFDSIDALVACEGVDLVHIATPPSVHHAPAMIAFRAGKHVLCEKPLALTVAEADEMLAEAAAQSLICPVDFVLRHNAVTDAVARLLGSGLLGKPLSARLTNCASDANLPPEHWFWDKSISGGIFIEHGVHFFDLYRHWLGPATLLSAHVETRPPHGQEDRVTCLLRHESGVLSSHYHGFDQTAPMDRTDHRIVCELGDVRVEGWIPLTLRLDAVVDDAAQEALADMLPGCDIAIAGEFTGSAALTRGRGVERRIARRIHLAWTPEQNKQIVYARSVSALMGNQAAFLADRSRRRVISESNGRDALALAQAAAEAAAHI